MKKVTTLSMAVLLALTVVPAMAQKTASQGIDEYRAMLQDGNPAELFEAKGEDLWKKARGPKNASLEKCDLGKGPGVVKGVFVELPRYFAIRNACRISKTVWSLAWRNYKALMLPKLPKHPLEEVKWPM